MRKLLSNIGNGIMFVVQCWGALCLGISAISGLCGIVYFFIPFGAFLKQCVQYLKHGIWKPYSIADYFGWIYPNSMYGLHNILDGINAVFLCLLIVPCLIWSIYSASTAKVIVDQLIEELKTA